MNGYTRCFDEFAVGSWQVCCVNNSADEKHPYEYHCYTIKSCFFHDSFLHVVGYRGLMETSYCSDALS